MKLYYFETINPQKACAVALHLRSPVEFVRIDLGKGENNTPDYRAMNPNAKVPLLVDGEKKLWEANAIMCHLAGKAGSDLWPKDIERQIEIMRWLSWDANHFTRHAGMLYFQHVIKPKFGMGDPDAGAVREATDFFMRFGKVLDDHLDGRRYLVGDALSVADFAVAITLPYAEKSKLPLDGFANVRRWHDRLNEMEAWRNPFPVAVAAAA